MCPSNEKLNDKIILITGATGGIGHEIIKEFCSRSVGQLILACRDLQKAAELKTNLLKLYPHIKIDIRHLDLASIKSTRQFAESIQNDFNRIDVLINNAGGKFKLNKTIDNFDENIQVNYLSHFLLTCLMLPMLKKSAQGRVINVTAHAYTTVKFNEANVLNSYEHNENNAFAISKLAVVASSIYLAKTLKGKWILTFHTFLFRCMCIVFKM